MELSRQQRREFLEMLWDFYASGGRGDLPWRQPKADGSFNPYKIMVSELMLQQTQVSRVIPKYTQFLAQFPNVHTLAAAELGDVLRVWQGLGYNRRAKYLWQSTKILDNLKHFPNASEDLVKLPGIGPNTAGAILAYAFDKPIIFIETNIRTVYLCHFFPGRTDVSDNEIRTVLGQTLDREHPREFYWALMDYGSYLKATVGNPNAASKHYTKQSKFHGSRRQIRGQILRSLGEHNRPLVELQALIFDDRLDSVLDDLVREGLIRRRPGGTYSL